MVGEVGGVDEGRRGRLAHGERQAAVATVSRRDGHSTLQTASRPDDQGWTRTKCKATAATQVGRCRCSICGGTEGTDDSNR